MKRRTIKKNDTKKNDSSLNTSSSNVTPNSSTPRSSSRSKKNILYPNPSLSRSPTSKTTKLPTDPSSSPSLRVFSLQRQHMQKISQDSNSSSSLTALPVSSSSSTSVSPSSSSSILVSSPSSSTSSILLSPSSSNSVTASSSSSTFVPLSPSIPISSPNLSSSSSINPSPSPDPSSSPIIEDWKDSPPLVTREMRSHSAGDLERPTPISSNSNPNPSSRSTTNSPATGRSPSVSESLSYDKARINLETLSKAGWIPFSSLPAYSAVYDRRNVQIHSPFEGARPFLLYHQTLGFGEISTKKLMQKRLKLAALETKINSHEKKKNIPEENKTIIENVKYTLEKKKYLYVIAADTVYIGFMQKISVPIYRAAEYSSGGHPTLATDHYFNPTKGIFDTPSAGEKTVIVTKSVLNTPSVEEKTVLHINLFYNNQSGNILPPPLVSLEWVLIHLTVNHRVLLNNGNGKMAVIIPKENEEKEDTHLEEKQKELSSAPQEPQPNSDKYFATELKKMQESFPVIHFMFFSRNPQGHTQVKKHFEECRKDNGGSLVAFFITRGLYKNTTMGDDHQKDLVEDIFYEVVEPDASKRTSIKGFGCGG